MHHLRSFPGATFLLLFVFAGAKTSKGPSFALVFFKQSLVLQISDLQHQALLENETFCKAKA